MVGVSCQYKLTPAGYGYIYILVYHRALWGYYYYVIVMVKTCCYKLMVFNLLFSSHENYISHNVLTTWSWRPFITEANA